MSNKDNIAIETSTAEVNLTSEMDVQPTPISQIDEADTPVSVVYVEAEKVSTSMSVSSEIKSDSTAAMMQLLLNKFDNFDKKLDEQKTDSNIKFTKLDENLSQLEKQKSNSSENSTKNEVLTNKVNNNDNVNNEFTDSKNMTGSKNL